MNLYCFIIIYTPISSEEHSCRIELPTGEIPQVDLDLNLSKPEYSSILKSIKRWQKETKNTFTASHCSQRTQIATDACTGKAYFNMEYSTGDEGSPDSIIEDADRLYDTLLPVCERSGLIVKEYVSY